LTKAHLPQNLKQEGPTHRVESLENIQLEEDTGLFLVAKKSGSLLN
jgi:hypothetical protein